MQLGLNLGYRHRRPQDLEAITRFAEQLGFSSVWAAEAYGFDALTPLAWLAARTETIQLGTAIAQIPARSPAMTAMTAATLDFLSQGRFLLGLGVSGPQVVEGWHGVPYGKPLGRAREAITIIRTILRRQEPLEHQGEHYQIPITGGTGLGKPLRLIHRPLRDDIPIYLAALGPRNIALAAEIANGWLPIFFSPEHFSIFEPHLRSGLEKTGRDLEELDIAPSVEIVVGPDVDVCRRQVKANIAFYAGGMGARGKNFYNDLMCRYGYREEAALVQDLFLTGQRGEATEAVPDRLVDQVALCGPEERIRERVQIWKDSPVRTLICATGDPGALELMAELVL